MNEKNLTITVNVPVGEVFEYTVNPANTSRWIDGVVTEEATPYPPQTGVTQYRNCGDDGVWTTYLLTNFVPGELFELTRSDDVYTVRYTYKSLGQGATELTYHEWVTSGELESPFPQSAMEKLKQNLEGN